MKEKNIAMVSILIVFMVLFAMNNYIDNRITGYQVVEGGQVGKELSDEERNYMHKTICRMAKHVGVNDHTDLDLQLS